MDIIRGYVYEPKIKERLTEINEVYCRIFNEKWSSDFPLDYLTGNQAYVILGLKEGRIIAMAMMNHYEDRIWLMYNFGVVPELRKDGLGKRLFSAICEFQEKFSWKVKKDNADAIRFYLRMGGKIVKSQDDFCFMAYK